MLPEGVGHSKKKGSLWLTAQQTGIGTPARSLLRQWPCVAHAIAVAEREQRDREQGERKSRETVAE